MSNFEQLKQKSHNLAQQIETATQRQDAAETIRLKKEFHKCKLEILELIDQEENTNSITARELMKRVEAMPKVPRYEVGIDAIDMELATDEERYKGIKGGIEIGTFIQFAGESGAGKTTLVLDILTNISKYSRVAFFNFEMGDKRIAHRLARKLKTDAQKDNFIIDSRTRKLDALLMEITIHARDGIKFFAIDSRMKIEVDTAGLADHQKTSLISAQLSKIAQEKEIIVFLINQMSDEAIKDNRMVLKNGGDQKYDADMMWFYIIDKKDPNKRILRCTKDRQYEHTWSAELGLNEGYTVGYRNTFNAMAIEVKYEHREAEKVNYEMGLVL
jgi:replicative DNA helicase